MNLSLSKANPKVVWAWSMSHKKTTAVILIAIGFVIYGAHSMFSSTTGSVKTLIGVVKKGSVVSKVTGSGQVAAITSTDVLSNVSGDIDAVIVTAGQEVRVGDVLARIDSTTALKAVTNAELSVANAQIAYDKASKQNSDQADGSSVSDLKKAYEKGYDAVTNTFIDLPVMFIDVGNLFYVPAHSPYFSDTNVRSMSNGGSDAITYKYQAGVLFDKSRAEYDSSFADYKTLSANSDPEKISAFLDKTYSLLRDLSAALTGTYSTIDYINTRTSNPPSQIASDKNLLASYINKVNADVASVSSSRTAIEDAKDSSASAALSFKSAELALSQQKDALTQAQQDLADHTVRAPFDGIVSKVVAEVGNKASVNGSMATVITKSQNVALSFNEIDAAKLVKGQKANLTFDAINGLTLTGTVTDIDVVGTISQGVVSYGAKISFDTNDDRIKPGMTVSASIIIASREDVVVLPSSVIQSKGDRTFVNTPSGEVDVTTGLLSDDKTEIISGINVGDQYVSSTLSSANAAATKTAASSLFGGAAAGGRAPGGAGAARMTGSATRVFGQ